MVHKYETTGWWSRSFFTATPRDSFDVDLECHPFLHPESHLMPYDILEVEAWAVTEPGVPECHSITPDFPQANIVDMRLRIELDSAVAAKRTTWGAVKALYEEHN